MLRVRYNMLVATCCFKDINTNSFSRLHNAVPCAFCFEKICHYAELITMNDFFTEGPIYLT